MLPPNEFPESRKNLYRVVRSAGGESAVFNGIIFGGMKIGEEAISRHISNYDTFTYNQVADIAGLLACVGVAVALGAHQILKRGDPNT